MDGWMDNITERRLDVVQCRRHTTHAQETCIRNLCKSSCTINLHECISVNLVQVFFLYKFLARN